MVKSLSTSLLLPAELAEIITRYTNAVNESSVEEPFLTRVLTLFSADLGRLNKAITAIRDNKYVDEVSEQDDVRDDLFIGFRDMTDAFKLRKKLELVTAYEKIWPVIEKTGTVAYKLGYTAESGKLAAMFAELDTPDMQAALATLGLTGIYNELKDAETIFASLHKDKLDEEAKLQYPTLQKAKRAAIPHVKAFISALGILEETEPETYGGLVKKVNGITEEIMTVVKARKTRNENESEGD